ncbi:hypothetical protein BDW66DRAFT_149718 [Aspergillus desertorum]
MEPDYGCGCGFAGDERNCEDDIEDPNSDTGTDIISLAARPLPFLLVQAKSSSTSRKSYEVKTKTRLSCIEETIPEEEEEEDEYLAQQRPKENSKQHRRTTSRRNSMIELFILSTWSSSGTASNISKPRLSLSFSNLSFRFPMPPIWGSVSSSQQC